MSGCILVVDDDADLRQALKDQLEEAGYRVETAKDGMDAIRILDEGVRPCVVFLDLMMPRMDGREFIRNRGAELGAPVIMMTAFLHEQVPEGVELLRKPFDLERLLETVARYCGDPNHEEPLE